MVKFFNKLTALTMFILLFAISSVAAITFISILASYVGGIEFMTVATSPFTLTIAALFALAVLVDAHTKEI